MDFIVQNSIHVANIMYLLSYLVKDILWLRLLTVFAGICLYPFYFFSQDKPLWAPIFWVGLFTLINIYQIYLLLLERRPVNLTPEEQKIYQLAFRTLTPREFKQLMGVAQWKTAQRNEQLITQGQPVEQMLFIYSGFLEVTVDEKPVAQIQDGQFVGEMSFMTGEIPTASVVSAAETTYVAWPIPELKTFLDKQQTLKAALQYILGTDLVSKLKVKTT